MEVIENEIVLSPKFEPLWKDETKRYCIITGGRGSSKSFTNSVYLLDLLVNNPEHKILFTRYTLTAASISIIPEFQNKIELMGFQKEFTTTKTDILCSNGSSLLFRGIKTSSGNQTANLKSIEGVTIWVLDEAEELIDENTFDKIDESIRKKGILNRVIMILNPVTTTHWIYKRFYEQGKREDTIYIHTTYLDNYDNLSESFLSKVEEVKKANPLKFKHRFLGEWLDKAEGVVFDNWKVGEFDNTQQIIYGQDYGFSNDPTTLIKIAIDSAKKILYCEECFYKPGLSTDQIFDLNKSYAESSLIIGDSAEPRLIYELKVKGNNIKEATKGAGSISAGLLAMQDYTIIVSEKSVNLQKELRNYIWLDKGSKLVIDDYNHCIDAIRYAFAHMVLFKRKYSF